MKVYNKLVRDNIPEIMTLNGAKPKIRILDEQEYLIELNKKLKEEVNEYLESNEVEEIADICEVILAILKLKKVEKDTFETIRINKVNKRGAFEKRIFLEKEE